MAIEVTDAQRNIFPQLAFELDIPSQIAWRCVQLARYTAIGQRIRPADIHVYVGHGRPARNAARTERRNHLTWVRSIVTGQHRQQAIEQSDAGSNGGLAIIAGRVGQANTRSHRRGPAVGLARESGP